MKTRVTYQEFMQGTLIWETSFDLHGHTVYGAELNEQIVHYSQMVDDNLL